MGNYEQELMLALLERMYDFCKAHDAQLIIVDIPRVTPSRTPIRSSVPDALRGDFGSFSDAFLHSSDVMVEFENEQIHVPHGQWHISEPAHAAIAKSSADVIVQT